MNTPPDTPEAEIPFSLDRLKQALAPWLETAEAWLTTYVLSWPSAVQLAVFVLAVLAARLAAGRVKGPLKRFAEQSSRPAWLTSRLARLTEIAFPLFALIGVWLGIAVLSAAGIAPLILLIIGRLLVAWVVIRLIVDLVGTNPWTSAAAIVVWLATALAILGLLDPVLAALDGAAFSVGELRISILTVINGIVLALALLWVASAVSRLVEGQLGRTAGLTPSVQVLIGKVVRIALYAIAVMAALDSVGIDLTALAIFSGAVGVGIGFGLQKVVSNLISGFILLLDRSIKPGDVIEIGDAYGWIEKLGARYVAIVTRDGKEYLIPNEDLITHQVINWSYSSKAVRLKIQVGISYDSDVRKALELLSEAAAPLPRVLKDPPPAPRILDFADSAVLLELRIWVSDPERGVVNVSSDVRMRIWDLFHEHGIKFPFPQRDIHIVSAQGLTPGQGPAQPLEGASEAPGVAGPAAAQGA